MTRDVVLPVVHGVQFEDADEYYGYEAENEHQAAEESGQVHGFASELAGEPQRHQVEVAVDETVEPEFCLSVFACLVVYHFLAYAAGSRRASPDRVCSGACRRILRCVFTTARR